jgi:hypothetical protein
MREPAEDPRNWRRLYKAALFETDTSKLPWRIEEARKALIFRSRELFKTSLNYDGETESIEDALYAPTSTWRMSEIEYNRSQTRSASRLDCSHATIMPCGWDEIAVSSLVVGGAKTFPWQRVSYSKSHLPVSGIMVFLFFDIDREKARLYKPLSRAATWGASLLADCFRFALAGPA